MRIIRWICGPFGQRRVAEPPPSITIPPNQQESKSAKEAHTMGDGRDVSFSRDAVVIVGARRDVSVVGDRSVPPLRLTATAPPPSSLHFPAPGAGDTGTRATEDGRDATFSRDEVVVVSGRMDMSAAIIRPVPLLPSAAVAPPVSHTHIPGAVETGSPKL